MESPLNQHGLLQRDQRSQRLEPGVSAGALVARWAPVGAAVGFEAAVGAKFSKEENHGNFPRDGNYHLVGGLVAIWIIFPINIGLRLSSQLTNSYFSEGWPNHQPVTNPIPGSYYTPPLYETMVDGEFPHSIGTMERGCLVWTGDGIIGNNIKPGLTNPKRLFNWGVPFNYQIMTIGVWH